MSSVRAFSFILREWRVLGEDLEEQAPALLREDHELAGARSHHLADVVQHGEPLVEECVRPGDPPGSVEDEVQRAEVRQELALLDHAVDLPRDHGLATLVAGGFLGLEDFVVLVEDAAVVARVAAAAVDARAVRFEHAEVAVCPVAEDVFGFEVFC